MTIPVDYKIQTKLSSDAGVNILALDHDTLSTYMTCIPT